MIGKQYIETYMNEIKEVLKRVEDETLRIAIYNCAHEAVQKAIDNTMLIRNERYLLPLVRAKDRGDS